MDDRANNAFAALPERIYVILDGEIVYEGGLGPFDYKIEEVEAFLAKRKWSILFQRKTIKNQ